MKRQLLLPTLALLTLLVFSSCEKDNVAERVTPPESVDVELRSSDYNFTASLSGDNEVPPNESMATGQCIVRIARDEQSIWYKLIVANAENVLASHFHMAPAGQNGPVVAFLFGGPPVEVQNGVLAEGTIEADDVIGQLNGDLAALIDKIRAGNIYVNVHTSQIPSGEIRGQVD